jgi:RND family efflux transporter MFP subunit
MHRMKNRFRHFAPAVCGTLVLLGLSLAGCRDDAPAPAGARSGGSDRPAVQVSLAPVREGNAWRSVEVTGTLFGEEEATIASKLSGRVEAIAADLGDLAPSGTVLARLEARDYELVLSESEAARDSALARLGLSVLPGQGFDSESLPAVRRARAEAANAAARLERAQQLFDQSPPLISEQDYADIRTANDVARETAETELLTAKALLAEARALETAVAMSRQKLSDTTVVAPAAISGSSPISYTVAQRMVSLGEYVTPGQAMFRLVATERIIFRARVAERFAGQVRPGQQVHVWVEAYGEPFVGGVSRVAPQIDQESRTFAIEVIIDNPQGRLKPGAFARGEVRLREESGIDFVPASALVTFAGVTRVFSVADGKAKEHRVRTGIRIGEEVEIIGGLAVSDVVAAGAAGLAEGVAVRIESP